MAVYVDKLRNWGWRLGPSCHLYADTNEELHAFAARIGLKRAWFQAKSSGPHYDLTKGRREVAIRLGAVEHTDRQMVDHMTRWTDESVAAIKAAPNEAEAKRIREYIFR